VDTSHETEIISKGLTSVIVTAQDLTVKTLSEGAGEKESPDNLSEEIQHIMNPLQAINEETFSLLGQVNTEGKMLSDMIMRDLSGITVHEHFDTVIQNVNADLKNLIADMRSILPAKIIKENRKEMEKLENRYTMDREREIHQSLTESRVAVQPAMIPDVPAASGKREVREGTTGADNLGDNVELF
jgi:hypothetical protein